MSICRGVAGNRGRNPAGIFIHNDAGSKNANAAFYRNWLQTHPLENGFAHYYVAQDGILQAEDDMNCAWHCGDTNGNLNYLGIETCQSMGDLDVFKANEEKHCSWRRRSARSMESHQAQAQSDSIRKCMPHHALTDL